MKIGEVSPVIGLKTGFAIFRLEDVRFPENEEAKGLARMEALRRKQGKALEDYGKALKKKYVKVNQKVLDSINYDVDNRVSPIKRPTNFAEITGKSRYRGRTTDVCVNNFYHGVEWPPGCD
jgi:hypothetical protein